MQGRSLVPTYTATTVLLASRSAFAGMGAANKVGTANTAIVMIELMSFILFGLCEKVYEFNNPFAADNRSRLLRTRAPARACNTGNLPIRNENLQAAEPPPHAIREHVAEGMP